MSAVTATLGSQTFQDPQSEAQLKLKLQEMIDDDASPTWRVGGAASPKTFWVWRDGRWVRVDTYILEHDEAGTYMAFTKTVDTVDGDVVASYELTVTSAV